MNYSQQISQAQIEDSILNSDNINFSRYDQELLQSARSCNMQVLNLEPSIQNIEKFVPIVYHDKGMIFKIDIGDIMKIKNIQIEKMISELDISDKSVILEELIPNDNLIIYANSLMNINEVQVQSDINRWVGIYERKYVSNFNYIRYFYFKGSESFNQDQPQNFGKLVKYKNQIVVMIGIIEQCLDQPFIFYPTFKKIVMDLKHFSEKDIKEIKTFNINKMINVLKQLYYRRLTEQSSSFDINQMFFRYLNKNGDPTNILTIFIKNLLEILNQKKYDQENMDFLSIQYPQVKIYSDSQQQQQQQQDDIVELKINILYETLKKQEIKNCYLLYYKPFLKESGKLNQEVLPLICNQCQSVKLTQSINYVIEKLDKAGQRIRLCKKCFDTYS